MIEFRVARNENRMNPMELDHGNWERRSGRLEFELTSTAVRHVRLMNFLNTPNTA